MCESNSHKNYPKWAKFGAPCEIRSNTVIGDFEGFFKGAKTFLTLWKNPENSYIRIQKITSQTIRISGALVFLCTGATVSPTFFDLKIALRFEGQKSLGPLNNPLKSPTNSPTDKNPLKYIGVVSVSDLY